MGHLRLKLSLKSFGQFSWHWLFFLTQLAHFPIFEFYYYGNTRFSKVFGQRWPFSGQKIRNIKIGECAPQMGKKWAKKTNSKKLFNGLLKGYFNVLKKSWFLLFFFIFSLPRGQKICLAVDLDKSYLSNRLNLREKCVHFRNALTLRYRAKFLQKVVFFN